MKKYYITYGMSDSQPFKGGWSTVYAKNEEQARKKHAKKYGFTDGGYLRFAFSYSEERWEEMDMKDEGNLGYFEHEVIR